MVKILITGTQFQNKGAGALITSVVKFLQSKDKNIEISMLSPNSDIDKEFADELGIKCVDIRYYNKSIIKYGFWILKSLLSTNKKNPVIKEIQESDIIVDLNGISFTDSFTTLVNLSLAIRFMIIKKNKKPIIMYSQSFGPFKKLSTRIFAKIGLKLVNHIVPRGQISKKNVESLGIRTSENIYPDCAFCLETKHNKNKKKNNNQIQTLSIMLNQHIHKQYPRQKNKYVKQISQIVNNFLENNDAEIMFIPHFINNHKNDDIFVAREVYAKIKQKDKVKLYEENTSPEVLKGVIENSDLIISSRYHAIIAGLSLGIPCMILGWSHKYQELIDLFKSQEYIYDYKNLDISKFSKDLNEFWSKKDKIKKELAKEKDIVIKQSKDGLEYLYNMIKNYSK